MCRLRIILNRVSSGVFVLLLFMSSCSDGLPKEFVAPDFVLKDLFDGRDIRLADFKGNPVILYFFASW